MNAQENAANPIPVTDDLLEQWATGETSAVALRLKQRLLPIEEAENNEGIVFPPTYADIGYNIDTVDGKKVATIDSVGSQANRMEPLFKEGGPLARLVPQIKIKINDGTTVSIFDLPHRAADATVQSSPGLAELAATAFQNLKQGNAAPLCTLAPTSLLFGVWDSRGGTGEKRPRLVRSVIRAWDVEVFHAAAQFNSVWKRLNEEQRADLEKEAKDKKVKLSDKGFKDAPATFRKIKENKIQQFRDGAPNPDARVLGGVLVKKDGRIEREVIINLLALRGLRSADNGGDETKQLRRYLLGLTLLAATQDMDLFLREGCLLRYANNDDEIWSALPRRGNPQLVKLSSARDTILNYTQEATKTFSEKWPDLFKDKWPKKTEEGKGPVVEYEFNVNKAKKLLAKKTEEEETGGEE